MRILHVCSSIDPATGGPANVLDRLARIQAAAGHDVTVVVADDPNVIVGVVEGLQRAGVRTIAGGPPSGPLYIGRGVLPAVREAIARGVDVAHVHGVWLHPQHWSSALLRRAGVPYVFRPCGMLDPWCLRQGALKKKLFLWLRGRRDLNAAAGLHFTTETERRLVRPLGLSPREFVIPNGIEWSEFDPPPAPSAFRRAHGIDAEAPLVVFLSRLHYKKGIELLLPAFARAAAPEARLALCGPGEADYVQSLKRIAADLGLADRVLLPGMIKGRARLEALADADVFCLPSYQENFGVAVVEAAGVGTAVLISDQVNVCDEVAAAGAGEVTPCAVEPLTQKLRAMLADRRATRAMGARGRAWARGFDWNVVARRIEEMYREIRSP